MIDATRLFGSICACSGCLMLLAGCGRSVEAPPNASRVRPDVIITVDSAHRTCSVGLYSEAQGSAISCGDVVPFVRDELRVPSGSRYELRKKSDADDADMAKVMTALNGAGYRVRD